MNCDMGRACRYKPDQRVRWLKEKEKKKPLLWYANSGKSKGVEKAVPFAHGWYCELEVGILCSCIEFIIRAQHCQRWEIRIPFLQSRSVIM